MIFVLIMVEWKSSRNIGITYILIQPTFSASQEYGILKYVDDKTEMYEQ